MGRTMTITLDDERIARAEALAAAQGMTLNEWLDRLVKVVTDPTPVRTDLPPITRSALGMLKDLPDKPYKNLLEEALLERYGFSK